MSARSLGAFFSTDLRSIALFRVALAGLLLCNIAGRIPDAAAFYTDGGLVPRTTLIEISGPWQFSLHLASGTGAVIGLALALQLLLAGALLLGTRARPCAFASFVLLGSLNARNPFVLVPGDTLTVALVFWGSLLPLGARWSLDAARATGTPDADASRTWGAAGVLVHALLALGLALYQGWPLPWAPLIVSAPIMLPAAFWERLRRLLDHGRRLRIYYDKDCEPCRANCNLLIHLLVLPRTEVAPGQEQARIRALMESRNSWVIVDASDVAHTRWRGFVAMLRHSLLFGWLAPLAGLAIWERPGDALYDYAARRWRRAAPPRVQRPHASSLPGLCSERVALIMLVLLPVWALATSGTLPAPIERPLLAAFSLGNLDLRAGATAVPTRALIPVGRTADGRDVNVLDADASQFEAAAQSSRRWRAWQGHSASRESLQRQYAAYLCRSWAGALESVRLIDLVPRTDASGYEQQVLWRNPCGH